MNRTSPHASIEIAGTLQEGKQEPCYFMSILHHIFRRLPFELERPKIKTAPEIKHVHLALSKFRNNSTI